MQKVPLGMHEQLDRFGTNIVVGDKRTNEYPPANIREGTPRGYQEGQTFDLVPAVYCSPEKTAIAGNPQGLKPEDCVLHEMGHAVDHMYGWDSHRSPQIEKAWTELNDRLSDADKKYAFAYYVGQQTKDANLDESFAESFKDYHKYGEASCTQKWGKGFSDVHAMMDKQAQYHHDANEAEKAGIESNWPQHEKIQY